MKWIVVFLFSACVCSADDLLLPSGVILTNITIIRHDPASVYVRHASGIERVPLVDMPATMQERYGYSPEAAEHFLLDEQSKANAERHRREQEASVAAPASSATEKIRTASNSDCILVKDTSWRQVEQNEIYSSYSVMTAVQNNCSSSVKLYVKLQAVDKAGFEVDSKSIRASVGGNATTPVTEKMMVRSEVARQIAQWKIKSIELEN